MNIETWGGLYTPASKLLIRMDLIAFDGYYYQTLSLPDAPLGEVPQSLVSRQDLIKGYPEAIQKIIREEFYGL